MQASKQSRRSSMPKKLCYQPMNQLEFLWFPPFQNQHLCSDSPIATFDRKYCTLESSSTNGEYSINYRNTSSSLPFSPSGSFISHQCSDHSNKSNNNNNNNNTYGSPISSSCITDEVNDLRYKLRELETVMLGPDPDFLEDYHDSNESSKQITEAVSKGDLKQVLIACAQAVSNNDLSISQWLINELRILVSVSGEPIQRLGAYMLEGLVARISSSGSCIYKSLRCKELASSSDLLSYMHILYEVCPYFKFGYMSANGAIAEAMKDENRVHIIDFQIGLGSQWITLIQAFAARPGGPPHIRITGIDDSVSANARGGRLNLIGKRLMKLARSFKVPFEFHAAAMSGCEVEPKDLGVQPGDALAVNFAFMLHHMPDESVTTMNHRDRLLRLVKGLAPKVVTLVEQESNTNTAAFYSRFLETMDYYKAMFESIDVTLPREHRERINVEQHCLAREVVNIIACEGGERVERHELLGKWRSRFSMAGFSPYPLSLLVNATIKRLLQNYSDKYRLEEREGALYLGWMNRDLVTSCAWK